MSCCSGLTKALGLLFVCVVTYPATAQIENIDESFSGRGVFSTVSEEHSGLDNPGWRIGWTTSKPVVSPVGMTYDLTPTSPERTEFAKVARRTAGAGSFTEVVEFSGLSIGKVVGTPEENPSMAGIALRHLLADNAPSRIHLSVLQDAHTNGGDWRLLFAVPFVDLSVQASVPQGKHLRLGIEYDEAQQFARAFYDSDTTDGVGPTYFEASLSQMDMGFETYSELSMNALGETHHRGELTRWRIVPWTDVQGGDFNASGGLDSEDIERIYAGVRGEIHDRRMDLNSNERVTYEDVAIWVHDVKRTFFGDANLDGKFDSADLVRVFAVGKFEFGSRAGWSEGDWDGDEKFSTSDLVIAFQDGGYENAEGTVKGVPEPANFKIVVLVSALGGLGLRGSSGRKIAGAMTTIAFRA